MNKCMVYLYAINSSEEITIDDWELLYKRVTDERKLKIDRYRFLKDKKRSLLAEILLGYALRLQYGIRQEEIKFSYNEYGKPEIAGRSDIYFNLSHSGDWVVCAVGDIPVGIDVEIINDVKWQICDKVLTSKEYEVFINSRKRQNEYFFQIWTLKESYVKAIGTGLALSFDRIEFDLDEKKVINVALDGVKDPKNAFISTVIDKNHMLAVCAKTQETTSHIGDLNYLKMKQLLSPYHYHL